MPMGEMPMPGGWMLSMMWMRMPEQTWPGAAASFLAMWTVMMAAMMLPSLVAALRRYRRAIARDGVVNAGRHLAVAAVAYIVVWAGLGVAVFSLGAALAGVAMREPLVSRAAPIAAGVVVLAAGALQLTRWKARRLACCAQAHARGTAWRYGLTLGVRCASCCAGPMAVLIVAGMMDLRAMVIVTAAITAERLATSGVRIARLTGGVALGAGVLMIARATGVV